MDDDVRSLNVTEVREYTQILDREIEMLTSQRRNLAEAKRLDLAYERKLEIHTLERAREWFVSVMKLPASRKPEDSL